MSDEGYMHILARKDADGVTAKQPRKTTNSNQADPPRLYAIDSRLVRLAEDVRDMGERVLRGNPHDRHYAIEKLDCAFRSAARALIEELDVDGEELVWQYGEWDAESDCTHGQLPAAERP